MGKRSPILGYNHNVRYRGLVFHVQTEDSGVASPHLFTHLFHSGVIVSTRKLVYDAGSAEDSIKSLMQAQHKATLKDLRRGHFDDKIDSYLGGTPGLLPRGSGAGDGGAADDKAADAEPSPGTVEDVAVGAPTEQVLPVLPEQLSEPVLITERPTRHPLIPPPPLPRVPTGMPLGRGTPASVDTTLKTAVPVFADATVGDDATQAVAAAMFDDTLGADPPQIDELDAPEIEAHEDEPAELTAAELDAPEIEIQLELDENDEAVSRASTISMSAPPAPPRRATRDTELQPLFDATRPTLDALELDPHTRPTLGAVNEEAKRASTISDGVPSGIRASSPAIPPPLPSGADTRTRLGEARASTINASALPPARPISRPQARPALSQPQVVTRPATSNDVSRPARESDPVEVYSPAPASAELPGERPGQYAQHKKASQRIPVEGLKNERSGGVAIPAGLGRPHRASTPANAGTRPGSTPPPMSSGPTPTPGAVPIVTAAAPASEPVKARAPTPSRVAPPGSSGVPRAASSTSGSGVVMTRPAVIVGAPAKAATATVPRIRKAREDEGRGFGQGLISEKSLDEVILAYLSEDADEK
ncbi:MAG TPA: hypothetical protein VFP84_12020 [Kofleriaceae bacterium]|nr:hypothetical protein [Kofleriaceae bacterium]